MQSWALPRFFQVRSSLNRSFYYMDRYCSNAHFPNFHERSIATKKLKKTVIRSFVSSQKRLIAQSDRPTFLYQSETLTDCRPYKSLQNVEISGQ